MDQDKSFEKGDGLGWMDQFEDYGDGMGWLGNDDEVDDKYAWDIDDGGNGLDDPLEEKHPFDTEFSGESEDDISDDFIDSIPRDWRDNYGQEWDQWTPMLDSPFTDTQIECLNSEVIRNVEFLKYLGGGSFSDVYRVLADYKQAQVSERILLACKVIRHREITVSALKRSFREIFLLKGLKHDNICNMVEDLYIKDSLTQFPYSILCLFLEYCHGDLEGLTNESGILEENLSKHWLRHVATGLAYLHERGVTHRDIYARNILCQYDTNPGDTFESRFLSATFKMADFDVSKKRTVSSEKHQNTMKRDIGRLLDVLRSTGVNPSEPVSENMKDLMDRMNEYPDRISAKEILDHPWLEISDQRSGISEKEYDPGLFQPMDNSKEYTDRANSENIEEDTSVEGKAIPTDELKFYEDKGITFDNQLGSGAFGTVWSVTRANFNTGGSTQLACRVTQISAIGSPPCISFWVIGAQLALETAVEFLTGEAEDLNKLNHINVVRMSPMFIVHKQVGHSPYVRILLFMELCDGDLMSLILEIPNRKLKEPVLLDMMRQVSQGLRYLHGQDLCHFDIKPQNILYVNQSGGQTIFKLGDFGLAKRILPGSTNLYMAPEMSTTDSYAHKPTDVYSLGMVLSEALTGGGMAQILCVSWIRTDWTTKMDEIAQYYKVSPLCVDVIRIMSEMEPSNRATIDAVCTHQWITGPTQQQSGDS